MIHTDVDSTLIRTTGALVILSRRGGGGDPVRGLLLDRALALFPEYGFEEEAAGTREDEVLVVHDLAEGQVVARLEVRQVVVGRYQSDATVSMVELEPLLSYAPAHGEMDIAFAGLVLAMSRRGVGDDDIAERRRQFWARAVELELVPALTSEELKDRAERANDLAACLYRSPIRLVEEERPGRGLGPLRLPWPPFL